MYIALKRLMIAYPKTEFSVTDMDQLQWLDVYGMTSKDFLIHDYRDSITSIDRISLTKPKIDRPIWAKGMHKEGWWWTDRHGKRWQSDLNGGKTEVNMNKTYS